ncbi:flavodoxin family protein [Desulfomarina profundi]|uniref:flavodoxin family protein n=1 Tax=Desulfomarina profundi TaxID=2772557 RepID=UPI001E6550EB|nr:hypothetical protein [Desulfomarina profundi]
MRKKRVLIIYYSFTGQTKLLLNRIIEGLEGEGIEVTVQQLTPVSPYDFPFKSYYDLLKATIQTFFSLRSEIKPVEKTFSGCWSRIILAGPTWSYHPSGPVLDFLDRYGKELRDECVIPLISCRAYWRIHHWELRRHLKKYGARMEPPIVFTHLIREPWRTIGLILQLRGKMVRRENSWFRKRYPGYGHNREQTFIALDLGKKLAQTILAEE